MVLVKKDTKLPYFTAQQAELVPSIQVFVTTTADVSIVIHVARVHQYPFAVKSGGHGVYPGASSVEDGILIDLSQLAVVEVSTDRKSVTIGSGAKWGDVYSKLDGVGLSVPGGRISSVGVGGLTAGGRSCSPIFVLITDDDAVRWYLFRRKPVRPRV